MEILEKGKTFPCINLMVRGIIFFTVFIGGVDAELQAMILKMSPMEQKWLIRILLKDMSLGISHGKILQIFHQDANDYFDVTNDLQKVNVLHDDVSKIS